MITAGIDVGIEYSKIVILQERKLLAKGITRSGGALRERHVQELWKEVLGQANMQAPDVEKICITGKGKYNTGLEGCQITELSAAQAAVQALHPEAVQTVISGADETIVFEHTQGKITEYTLNQKCSAGLGLFLEEAADLLGKEHFTGQDLPENTGPWLNDACVSFAGLDLLEGLNQNVPKEQLAGAALRFAAAKLAVVLNDITLPLEGTTVLAGGLFLYPAIRPLLEAHTGRQTYVTAQDPEYFTAQGAAFHAASLLQ